jgi:hypothetical protein
MASPTKRPRANPPPVDLLLPGRNLKEFCTTLPELGRRAPYVAIRKRVDLTPQALRGVRGLYAVTSFCCRTPAPDVHELLLDTATDEETIRCFTGLVNARIGSGLSGHLVWFEDSKLQGLAFPDRSESDWQSLRSMTLSRLSLTWTEMPLEYLPPSLRWLNLGALRRLSPRQLEPLAALTCLETLRLTNVDLGTLASMSRLESLTDLSVASTKSLRGIGRLERLRSLHVGGTTCPPVSELLACHALRELSIRARTPPDDLEALGSIVGLEKLTLDLESISDLAEVDSIGFLRPLVNLRELNIYGVRVRDRDVSPITELRGLEVLRLRGAFGPGIVRLRRAKPGRQTTIHEAPDQPSDPLEPMFVAGTWSLFADVSVLLRTKNNHDAERAIRRQLNSVAPDLGLRLEFDSEADSFCANATSRSDLQELAGIIRTMATVNR